MIKAQFLVAVFVALVGLSACESESSTDKVDCDTIAERCHPFDPGSGPIHECHEFAEDPSHTNEQCAAMRVSCLALCTDAADAGSDAAAP